MILIMWVLDMPKHFACVVLITFKPPYRINICAPHSHPSEQQYCAKAGTYTDMVLMTCKSPNSMLRYCINKVAPHIAPQT